MKRTGTIFTRHAAYLEVGKLYWVISKYIVNGKPWRTTLEKFVGFEDCDPYYHIVNFQGAHSTKPHPYMTCGYRFDEYIHPLVAKQCARGLAEKIPEDCAGIIERMLVGNSVVGVACGPDRYAKRV
jgi:hypothetical protein